VYAQFLTRKAKVEQDRIFHGNQNQEFVEVVAVVVVVVMVVIVPVFGKEKFSKKDTEEKAQVMKERQVVYHNWVVWVG